MHNLIRYFFFFFIKLYFTKSYSKEKNLTQTQLQSLSNEREIIFNAEHYLTIFIQFI